MRYLVLAPIVILMLVLTSTAYAQLCPGGVCPVTPTLPEKTPTIAKTTEIIPTTEVVATTEVPPPSPRPSETATEIPQTLPPQETPTATLWQYPTRTKHAPERPKEEIKSPVLPSGGGVPSFQATEDAMSENPLALHPSQYMKQLLGLLIIAVVLISAILGVAHRR